MKQNRENRQGNKAKQTREGEMKQNCGIDDAQGEANYKIAFMLEATGDFEIVEEFEATSDEEANAYAEQYYGDREWYVLNEYGENINK